MSESIDKEMLATLAEEIRDFLPKIIDKVESYKKDPHNVQDLRDAHRYLHTVKGASSMVGLSELSHLGYNMENTIEEVLLAQMEISPKMTALIYEAVALIDEYLDKLLTDHIVEDKQLFDRLTQQFSEITDQLREKNVGLSRKNLFYEDDLEPIVEPQEPSEHFQQQHIDDEMQEFIEAFLPEAKELQQTISTNLNILISNPTDKELIEKVRRPIHTLKGAAGLVKFQTIYTLSFDTQKLLEYLYENEIIPSEECFSLLSWYTQQLKSLIDECQLKVTHLSDEYSTKCENLINKLEESKTHNAHNVGSVSFNEVEIEEAHKELIEAFLIEAQEHWQSISQNLTNLAQQPSNTDLLQEVRRYVHTLKGAANMVGFITIGKLTHRMEDLLDYLYDNQIAPDTEVINLLFSSSDAVEEFITEKQDKDTSFLVQTFDQYQKVLDKLGSRRPSVVPTQKPLTFSSVTEEIQKFEQNGVSSQLMEAFLAEANEYSQNISTTLRTLVKKPKDKELLKGVRRPIHALKGAAGVVKFQTIYKLTSVMEDLLDSFYDKDLFPNPEVINLLFSSLDVIDDLINSRQTNDLSLLKNLFAQYQKIFESLNVNLLPEVTVSSSITQSKKEINLKENTAKLSSTEEDKKVTQSERRRDRREETGYVRIPIERLDEIIKLVGELVINRSSFEQHFDNLSKELDELNFSINRARRVSTKLETDYGVMALGSKALNATNGRAKQIIQPAFLDKPSITTTTSAHEFDELEFDRYTEFNVLLKELVETSTDMNTVSANLRNTKGDFDSYSNRLARLTRETQDKLMQLRMVPVAALASRLHRTVRTTAVQQQKSVELILEGEQIELDKTVLEEITDPLFHILRNAVDHGIEPPSLRQALGKAEKGEIHIQAYYEGTYAVICVSDDGSGLNTNLIRATAVSRGIISESEANAMTDEELFPLIFIPGFSTAKEVSEISGRGVGMDIVKAKVQKMKGTINVLSIAGQGTTFTIKLPMTLAITRVLMVEVGKNTFAIPLSLITQIFRVESSNIQILGDKQVVRVQNEIYPLASLADLLELKQSNEELEKKPILIVSLGERKIALIVDVLQEQREVVVKNLGTHLRRLHGITGATLMGDGSVVLILNLAELLENILGRQETNKPIISQTKTANQKPDLSKTQNSFLTQNHTQSSVGHSVVEPIESSVEIPIEPTEVKVPKRDTLNVLIVDDSLSVRTVISNLIKKTGWTPITAKDGMDALQMLQQVKELPDVLLVDIEMPRMDGYELTSALKGQENYKHLPVIMLTSRAGGKHRQRAMDIGVDEYLIKPYQDEVLLTTIKRLTKFE